MAIFEQPFHEGEEVSLCIMFLCKVTDQRGELSFRQCPILWEVASGKFEGQWGNPIMVYILLNFSSHDIEEGNIFDGKGYLFIIHIPLEDIVT